MVEARVKRIKDIGNEEEASEGASNHTVIASLRWSVGRHTCIGASESDSPEQKKKYRGKKRLNTSFWRHSRETSYARGLEANSGASPRMREDIQQKVGQE